MSCARLRSLVITLLTLTASASLALAQRDGRPLMVVEINGQVRFVAGGAPAEHVLVTLENFNGGLVEQVRTDRLGKFRFAGLAPELYRVTVRHPGFNEVQQEADLRTTTTAYLPFQLTPEKSTAPTESANPSELFDAKTPAEARKEYEKGRAALLDEKKVESGILSLEKAISLYPNFLEAHLLLGTAYLDAQQLGKAERTLRRALEIDPKLAAAYFTLGEVYRRQQKYTEAEKALKDGLQLEPRSPQGHFALGQVYFAKGDLAKAGPEVGQAIQLKPDFAEAHLLAGNLFLRARQPENALQMFQEYLRLDPQGTFAAQTQEVIEKIKKALAEKKK